MDVTAAPRRDSVWQVQFRVIRALMLRDLRTRFFGHGLGYIIAVLWPLTHMAVLLSLYYIMGRVAPYGESPLQYFAIALVPAISFLYVSRQLMNSVKANRPLMTFPIVKFVDLVLARGLIEAMCVCCVALLMASILFVLNVPIAPDDVVQASCAFGATLLLGFGIGTLNGVIVLKLPGWSIAYLLISIVMYVTSGVVFLPESMPEQAKWYLSWNPLLHCIEWIRQSFFSAYTSTILDKTYVFGIGIGCLFIGLLAERLLRQFLYR